MPNALPLFATRIMSSGAQLGLAVVQVKGTMGEKEAIEAASKTEEFSKLKQVLFEKYEEPKGKRVAVITLEPITAAVSKREWFSSLVLSVKAKVGEEVKSKRKLKNIKQKQKNTSNQRRLKKELSRQQNKNYVHNHCSQGKSRKRNGYSKRWY